MEGANVSADSSVTVAPQLSRKRWWLVTVLSVAVLSAFFDRINIAVLFTNKDFQRTIGVHSPALLGLLMTGFLFAYGVSAILLSFVGDTRAGPRRSLLLLTVVWGVMMALMGMSSAFVFLLVLRVLLGVSEGPQWSLNIKLIKRWFPLREQGRASAMWNIGSPLGSAIGFPLVIFVVARFGWRTSFFTLAAISLIVVLPLIAFVVRDYPRHLTGGVTSPLPPPGGTPETDASHARRPSLRDSLAQFAGSGAFWMVTLLFAGYLSLLWGLNSWLPSYLRDARHFGTAVTGLFSSLPFIAMFFGELLGAYLGDRWMKRAAVCLVSVLAAAVLLYVAALVPSALAAGWLITLSMFFLGGSIPPSFAILLHIVPEPSMAMANGVCLGVGNLISALVPFVMGALIGASHNYNSGLYLLVAIGVVGSLTMLPLLRRY